MSGRWQAGAAPVLVGVVAGVLVGFMGIGSSSAQSTGTGTGSHQPAVVSPAVVSAGTAGSHHQR